MRSGNEEDIRREDRQPATSRHAPAVHSRQAAKQTKGHPGVKHAADWKTILHADRQVVEQAKRHYLPWVRVALRDTMGLTLSRGGTDGIRRPEHEVRIEVEDGAATHWARRLWRSLPVEGREALGAGEALGRTLAAVRAVERETLPGRRQKWTLAGNQLERLEHAGKAALKALRDAVQALERGEADRLVDPFGTYTRARGTTERGQAKGAPGHIKLWWFPIAIMARTTGTSVPHFTLSTLAHEMAHAYSDAGVDGDRKGWTRTEAPYGGLKLEEVEAIAEAWTDIVMLRRERTEPGIWKAHVASSQAWQWGPYVHHLDKDWLALDNEGLRAALLEVRRDATGTMGEAVERLKKAEKHQRSKGEHERWLKRSPKQVSNEEQG